MQECRINSFYLTDFKNIRPKYLLNQEDALEWLASAHACAEKGSQEFKNKIQEAIQKYCCKPTHIHKRAAVIADFTHTDWKKMTLYPLHKLPEGHRLSKRSEIFKQAVDKLFVQFYPSKAQVAPDDLIHVTCTGYNCPSGAQKRVVELGWEGKTCVTHAYHMGCMGAIKAIRIGCGLSSLGQGKTDIVHTELCSLHLNPTLHTPDQLIGASLFADGFIKYSILNSSPQNNKGFIVNAVRDEIIPKTAKFMEWECKEWGFQMTLSKEIPFYIARALPGFVQRLFEGIQQKDRPPLYAIHPGGPKIIDQVAKVQKLNESQIAHTKKIFFECGNMSSATLPHIWENILNDPKIEKGQQIVSLAFGPGLTICGILLTRI